MSYSYKTQIFQPTNNVPDRVYTISHQFDVPTDETSQKRGVLFASMSLTVTQDFDLESITKLFLDNIFKTYYEITDKTPLQALESTVQQTLELIKTSKSRDESITFETSTINSKKSVAIALVWNHILYVANIGKNANYIIRGSGTRDLLEDNTDSSEIKVTSMLLLDDDIIIIGTEKFAELFPAKDILENITALNNLLDQNEKYNMVTALVIKAKDTKSPEPRQNSTFKALLKSKISELRMLNPFKNNAKNLADEFKPYQTKKSAPISSITGLAQNEINKTTTNVTNLRRRIDTGDTFDNTKVVIGLAVFLLVISLISATYLSFNQEQINSTNQNTLNLQSDNITTQLEFEDQDTTTKDQISNALQNMSYYEIKQLDEPTKIEYYKQNFAIYVASQKALWYFDTNAKTLTKILSDIENFEQLKCFDKFCVLAFNKIAYIFDPNTPTKIDKYALNLPADIIDIDIHTDRVYYLTNESIYWVKIGDKDSVVNTWLKDPLKLQNALSFAIETDIYVLEPGKIRRFTAGTEQKFELNGQTFQNANSISVMQNDLYLNNFIDFEMYKFDIARSNFISKFELKDLREYLQTQNTPVVRFQQNKNPVLYFYLDQKIYYKEITK